MLQHQRAKCHPLDKQKIDEKQITEKYVGSPDLAEEIN